MTLQATRDLLNSEAGFWCCLATVQLHDGESQHHSVNSDGSMIISVKTNNGQVPMWCLMKGGCVDKTGVWKIPPIGTEVLVSFPDGDFEGDPAIVGFLGQSPSGLVMGKTFILDTEVQIRSVNGTARKVAFHDELTDLRNYVNNQFCATGGHTHTVVGGGTTGILTVGTPGIAPPNVPPAVPVGTSVGKME